MNNASEERNDIGTMTPGSVNSPSLLDPITEKTHRAEFEAEFGQYGWTVIVSLTLLCVALLSLVRLAYVSDRHNDGFLAILVGGLLGWAAGMFFSPYSTVEKSNFVSISQAVSAFVSGYLLSKLDRLLESSLFSAQGPVAATWTLIGFFTVAFLVFALGTYSCRRYFAATEPSGVPEQPSANPSVPAASTSAAQPQTAETANVPS